MIAPPWRTRPATLVMRVLLVCLACVFSGACADSCADCTCEHCMAEGAYKGVIEDSMRDFEYEAPPADTWREMRAVLKEHGFELAEVTPKENSTLTTPAIGQDSFDVRMQRTGANRYTLAIRHLFDEATDGGTKRTVQPDADVEWEVVQRVEPARAQKIRETAEAHANRSARIGRGCDVGCGYAWRACGGAS